MKNNIITIVDLENVIKTRKPIDKIGNGKTCEDLDIKFKSRSGYFFLCNAKDTFKIDCKIQLIWDECSECPGIFIESEESFINIPIPEKYNGEYALYYNTFAGKAKMIHVFNFLTSNK